MSKQANVTEKKTCRHKHS